MKYRNCAISAGWFLILLFLPKLQIFAADIRTLKSIDVQSKERVEQVRLTFDKVYEESPLINFEPGSLNLRLNAVTIDPVLPSLVLPETNRMIKAVHAFQTPNSQIVHLDIIFQSSRLLLEHPEIHVEGSTMILNLQLNPLNQSASLSDTNQLTEEIGKRVREDAAFPSTFTREEPLQPKLSTEDFLSVPDRDWVATMVTLVLSLLFILLLIYLLAFLYNRFLSGRFPTLKGRAKIRIVSTYHVAPKQKVVILQINEQFFACGVTPTSISLISELKDPGDQSFLGSIHPETPSEEIDIDRSRAEFMRALEKAREHARSTSPQLAEEEKSVSKLPPDITTAESLKATSASAEAAPPKSGSSEEETKEPTSFNTPVRNPFNMLTGIDSAETTLNPAIQDFASKLSKSLKSLKPIK